jgi:ABC-type microcin C transport system permease subunit YejE
MMNLFNDAKTSSSEITKGTDLLTTNIKDPIIQNKVREYVSSFSIYGLDEYNNKIIAFEYNNAFPTNLGEINFSNQDPSEINCSVTFAFNQLAVNLVKNIDDSSSCSS